MNKSIFRFLFVDKNFEMNTQQLDSGKMNTQSLSSEDAKPAAGFVKDEHPAAGSGEDEHPAAGFGKNGSFSSYNKRIDCQIKSQPFFVIIFPSGSRFSEIALSLN